MNINDIYFPDQIIDSIQEDKLVVFAGAGVSRGDPTSLPDFADLTTRIADGTGLEFDKDEDACEVFLGSLKARGVNVNTIAADLLSDIHLEHNRLHEAIIDLFPSPEKVKIVTTNYDQMFEQVMLERKIDINVFNSPALPLGNDVSGIIHIHGNVNNPKYMVLTDEDFGNAYLTEGYISRFLVKLFETYTVLFVGYSYSDTIVRYFTRAMSRSNSGKKFILTDNPKSQSDWYALGITPIVFPEKKFDYLQEGLIKLGYYTKRGLIEWHNQFMEIADAPPKDLTIDTEIDYCLERSDYAKVMASCVHGKEWLDLLERK